MQHEEYVDGGDIDLDEEVVLNRAGNRITEARAQELAEEAVEHFGAQRGRPSLSGASVPSPRVSFRVSPDLQQRAQQRAEEQGVSVSDLARQALESYLQ